MIAYNLYYNNKLVNSTPVNADELSEIMDKKKITKIVEGRAVKIKTDDLRVTECHVLYGKHSQVVVHRFRKGFQGEGAI